LLTCGAVTLNATAQQLNVNGCNSGSPPPAVCTALQATVLAGILCPTACPITITSSSCVCMGTTVVFTANTVCACPTGTITCPTSCPPQSCTNCGTCGNTCPAGNCCINGVCTASAGCAPIC